MGAKPSNLVLVVDDETDSASAAAVLLRNEGYSPKVANSYAEAIAFARRVDLLVITDIGPTEVSGERLLNEIRGFYPVRSIAVTGWCEGEIYAIPARSSFDRWLLKPVSMERLIGAVSELLQAGPYADGSKGPSLGVGR
jgi:CheY-like chemotaxis protein